MEPCYQLLDVAARTLKMAMETGGFYRTPAVLAAVRHYEAELTRIISSYADGGKNAQSLEAPTTKAGAIEEGDLDDDDDDSGESEGSSDAI